MAYDSQNRGDGGKSFSVMGIMAKYIGSGIAALGVIGGIVGYNTCTTYVKPDQFGVRQVDVNLLGMLGAPGIHSNVVQAGIRRRIPGFETIQVFPRTVQVITFKKGGPTDSGSKYIPHAPEAKIQTSDGNWVDVDVSVFYHISNPHVVLTKAGAGDGFRNTLMSRAPPVMKATFGQLTPEAFFDARLRVKKQEETKGNLNSEFNPNGINIDHVLIRFPHYVPSVQDRIEQQVVQEEILNRNKAQSAESEAQSRLVKIQEQGRAAVSVLLTNTQNQVMRTRALKDSNTRQKMSDADRLSKMATAESQMLINKAYEGPGSELLVGLEYARALKGLDTIVVPAGGPGGFNPLDLDTVLRTISGTNASRGRGP
jgi:regulator of protease activity HflC (stomatin/prohibitin superfamily)